MLTRNGGTASTSAARGVPGEAHSSPLRQPRQPGGRADSEVMMAATLIPPSWKELEQLGTDHVTCSRSTADFPASPGTCRRTLAKATCRPVSFQVFWAAKKVSVPGGGRCRRAGGPWPSSGSQEFALSAGSRQRARMHETRANLPRREAARSYRFQFEQAEPQMLGLDVDAPRKPKKGVASSRPW